MSNVEAVTVRASQLRLERYSARAIYNDPEVKVPLEEKSNGLSQLSIWPIEMSERASKTVRLAVRGTRDSDLADRITLR